MSEVLLLTQDDCDLCDHAKRRLASVTEEFELRVHEVSLETPEGVELARTAAAPFPPVVFLNGKPYSYGRLSARRLRKALSR